MFHRFISRHLKTVCVAVMLLASVSAHGTGTSRPRDEDGKQQRRDYRPRVVLRQPIRPIVDPNVVTADKAQVADNELVIGVTVNGAARAYPINQLTGPQREIINDVLGGTPIAATW